MSRPTRRSPFAADLGPVLDRLAKVEARLAGIEALLSEPEPDDGEIGTGLAVPDEASEEAMTAQVAALIADRVAPRLLAALDGARRTTAFSPPAALTTGSVIPSVPTDAVIASGGRLGRVESAVTVVAERLDEIARRLESGAPDAAENRADAVERRLADLAEQLRRLTSLLAG